MIVSVVSLFLFFLTHLPGLTSLPVFSDEAIYIRWAQVGLHEPNKYLFLSMLDGKPPLHVWSLMPFLQMFEDPLFAGRVLSLVFGMFSIYVVMKIIRLLDGSKRAEYIGIACVTFAPFWYMYHRLALAEAMLGFLYAVGMFFGLHLVKGKTSIWNWLGFCFSVGAALWTKTTAIFFIFSYATLPLFIDTTKKNQRVKWFISAYTKKSVFSLITAGIGGCLLFLLLKFSPLFPSLFSRSADYTFTVTDLLRGEWRYVLFTSIPRSLFWIVFYLTPFLIIPMFFTQKYRWQIVLFSLFYALPLLAGGRVVYPRYLFPLAIPLTLFAALGFDAMFHAKKWQVRGGYLTFGGFLIYAFVVIAISWNNPTLFPMVKEDKEQYLTSWSSGYGIAEVRAYLQRTTGNVYVATEGYFGTLPDGLQIYSDRTPDNLEIHGIGQPVREIPDNLLTVAQTRETYLIVNAHRYLVGENPHVKLVQSFPRPFSGPSLLLLRIVP
ncbi:MAG: glycosyltransferase family 39 protein [Candidatus Pacebacteria bacterium]|nr:glycosyltransferase family 39 protein [Candidatus Paceibacterota bacterium]